MVNLSLIFSSIMSRKDQKPRLIDQQACWPDTETYVWTRQQVCMLTLPGHIHQRMFTALMVSIGFNPSAARCAFFYFYFLYKSYPWTDMQMSFVSGDCPSYPKCAKLQNTSGVWFLVASRAPHYLTLWFQTSGVVEHCVGLRSRSFFGSPAPK